MVLALDSVQGSAQARVPDSESVQVQVQGKGKGKGKELVHR
jgi:hypothetical protein